MVTVDQLHDNIRDSSFQVCTRMLVSPCSFKKQIQFLCMEIVYRLILNVISKIILKYYYPTYTVVNQFFT